ncbi:hypothetical protein DM02DRAFT_660043 [Periconia macrospinosa]|uniref:Amino acid transporter transmembrane domain-containing protein n=1 Tax=Periconia macrospinosa TaxID=97972 RepID=A0A2V1DBP3_9PLEO|nr:hypothetical protein DM02DRAFT_660043 [Periconia macrospinosa]
MDVETNSSKLGDKCPKHGSDESSSECAFCVAAGGGSTTQDAVFGEITEGGPNYRDVGFLGTVALMMKTQVGLGVLSIPSVFDTLGMIPGIICLIVIATINTWSCYSIGAFKLKHPEVYDISDVGLKLFGPIGRECFAAAFILLMVFCSASGMLSIAISLNAISTHAVCTAVFVAVGWVIAFGCGSIQTLSRVSALAWVGLVSIIVAIFTVTIAVGVQERPYAAPREGVWTSDYKLFASPDFASASAALSSLVFAYGATPAFFSIVSEMREPRHYTRALIVSQISMTTIYIVIGIVVYYFCGSYVASPALGSAGPAVKKASYAVALPGLMASTMLLTHYPSKYIFVRALRNTRHLAANTKIHWATWLGCTFGVSIIGYIIASAIPVFGGLISLIGALFATFTSFQPMGCMWLYDNWKKGTVRGSRTKWLLMVCWAVFVIVIGTFLMVAGTYGSIVGIMDSYKASGGSAAWSCADNSNSV